MKEDKQKPITDFIIENIKCGKYKPNTKIMSEPLLEEKFKVARATVRRALDKLVEEEYIYKVKGSGNYVKERKKYILIIIEVNKLLGSNFYKNLIERLKKNIINADYFSYILTMNNNNFTLPLDLDINQIAGVICCEKQGDYLDIFEEHNIPITNIMSQWNEKYPGITINHTYFFDKILELIETYNFKKPLIIEYKSKKGDAKFFENIDSHTYMSENYALIQAEISTKVNEILTEIENKIKNLDYTPDLIVFTDDTLYTVCQNIFEKYDYIFSNTKIITHSNNNEIYNPKYNICKIAYNIEDFTDLEMKLLLQLINKENPVRVIYNISPTVIDEHKLQAP